MQYTLVGFSTELDWRPLNFVKPIPPNRVCAACGLVRKTTTFLPCTHVLCYCCYEQCTQEGQHICPIDGYECQDDEVERRECPVEEVLKRQVTCLNEGYGCKSVLSVSEVSCHFHRECSHHSVRCPKCLEAVLCSGMWSHLISSCSAQMKPLDADEPVQFSYKDDKRFLTTFRAAFEKQAHDIKAVLQRMDADIGDRLNEISSGMNNLKETLKEELADNARQNQCTLTDSIRGLTASSAEVKECLSAQRDTVDNLPNNIKRLEQALKEEIVNGTNKLEDRLTLTAAAIDAEGKKNTQMSLDKINEVLRHTQLHVTLCSFTVKGVNALQEKALKEGEAAHYSKTVYLRGFCIRPGVHLEKDGQSVKLRALLCLHKGAMDAFVRWPFGHKWKIIIMHPKHCATRELESKVDKSTMHCQRPTTKANQGFCLPQKSLDLSTLISDGYAENDQIRVQCELVP